MPARVDPLAQAHRQWMLPSATSLSGTESWVTVDAAISNDLFYFEHHPLQLDNLVVTTALPVIRTDLDASIEGLEWTVNAYTRKPMITRFQNTGFRFGHTVVAFQSIQRSASAHVFSSAGQSGPRPCLRAR